MGNLLNKRLWLIIGCVAFLLTFILVPAYADDQSDYDQHTNNAEKYRQQREAAEKQQKDLLSQIKDLNTQTNQKQDALNQLNSQLAQAKNQLAQTEQELALSQKKLDNKKEILKKRLRSMYSDGNVGYVQILLDSKNFSELINRFEFLKKIAEQDNKLLKEIKAEKKEVEKKRNQQKKDKDDIEVKQVAAQQAVNDLNSTIAQKDKTMKQAASNAQTNKKLEDEENQRAQEIANQIRARAGNNPYVGGVMTWPVPGYYKITSPFGEDRGDHTHTGIDIGAPEGKTIVAAQSGRVIYIETGWGGGYGNHVIIDHGGQTTTLYAHMSSISTSMGQYVVKGQTIGYVGNTGHSFGAHLHFEVRVNGNPVNPISYVKG